VPIDDAKKRELVAGITAILRQSPLHATIDTQRLAMAFSMVLVEPDQPVDLQHLYQWLISQNAKDKDALELCVVLKMRGEKIGAQFTAPTKAQYMDQAVLDDLAGRFQVKAERAQAWDKKAPEPLPASLGEKKEPPAWTPKKGGKQKPNRALPIVLVLTVVGGVGYWGFLLSTSAQPMRPVTLTDANGLKCDELTANERLGICRISRQTFAAETGDKLKTKAEATFAEVKKQKGTKVLFVMVDNRLKLRLP
jgi:hypothetical protein